MVYNLTFKEALQALENGKKIISQLLLTKLEHEIVFKKDGDDIIWTTSEDNEHIGTAMFTNNMIKNKWAIKEDE